ncbi:hypothetical protein BC940DRAFT_305684 [Gongronella butleri]|nr:hypothetical protein BC940DRAFT_305684 [Gongronella butleri]
MSTTGRSFVKTLRHYLDSNQQTLLSRNDKHPSDASRVSSKMLPISQASPWISPYLSLLALSSAQTTLEATPYMPAASCLALDIHYLYFLCVQFEHLGLDIFQSQLGNVPQAGFVADHVDDDTGKAASLLSVNSVASAMSSMSLGSGWRFWKQQANSAQSTNSAKDDLMHIYQFFSRISALRLHARVYMDVGNGSPRSGQRTILGYEEPIPKDGSVSLSMALFKQLQFLELDRVHPREIADWKTLLSRVISLVMKRSGIETLDEILCLADDWCDDPADAFSKLQMLSLQDNNLTTIDASASLGRLQAITHLNLSSNLLNDVPAALSTLFNLRSLNLANNMISSTVGINTVLGNIQELILCRNRLTKLVGIDRLWALERLDVRGNRLDDVLEVNRLLPLPNLDEIWVSENPFALNDTSFRVDIFSSFSQHDRALKLDGSGPTFAEKLKIQNKRANASQQDNSVTPLAIAPAVVPDSPSPSSVGDFNDPNDSPQVPFGSNQPANDSNDTRQSKMGRAKAKKSKRVVKLQHVDFDQPSVMSTSMESESQAGHVHRYTELQSATQHTSPLASYNHQRERNKTNKDASTSTLNTNSSSTCPSAAASSHTVISSSPSDAIHTENENGFRRRIEHIRQEAGTGWLRVLQEMNDKQQSSQ